MTGPARLPRPGPGGHARRRKPRPVFRHGPDAPRETIMLVDDEPQMRKFLSRVLAKEGYHVLVAADGESALALSEAYEGVIHLLVTDVMMPVMNGKDLADRLCGLRPDIRVLFISGYSRADFWPSDACEDMTDWLPKPFNAAQFHRKVREILDAIRNR